MQSDCSILGISILLGGHIRAAMTASHRLLTLCCLLLLLLLHRSRYLVLLLSRKADPPKAAESTCAGVLGGCTS